MSPFDPTFGSFGDFVSLVSLGLKIRTSLSDIHGASAEYEALLHSLDLLCTVLDNIHGVFSGRSTTEVSLSLQFSIQLGFQSVETLLRTLESSLSGIHDKLKPGGSRSKRHNWRQRSVWSLNKKEDVAEIQRQSDNYVTLFTSLTFISQWYVHSAKAVQSKYWSLCSVFCH